MQGRWEDYWALGKFQFWAPSVQCHCTYHVMLCCMKALVLLQRGGLGGSTPEKNFKDTWKWCNFMHFGSTKWIVIACSTGIYNALTSAPGPLLVRAPGKYPHLPPLSVGLAVCDQKCFMFRVATPPDLGGNLPIFNLESRFPRYTHAGASISRF